MPVEVKRFQMVPEVLTVEKESITKHQFFRYLARAIQKQTKGSSFIGLCTSGVT